MVAGGADPAATLGFPGLNAPASLKLHVGNSYPCAALEFSGAECPGLIEAAAGALR